jgi:hypothetical protein
MLPQSLPEWRRVVPAEIHNGLAVVTRGGPTLKEVGHKAPLTFLVLVTFDSI